MSESYVCFTETFDADAELNFCNDDDDYSYSRAASRTRRPLPGPRGRLLRLRRRLHRRTRLVRCRRLGVPRTVTSALLACTVTRTFRATNWRILRTLVTPGFTADDDFFTSDDYEACSFGSDALRDRTPPWPTWTDAAKRRRLRCVQGV